MSKGKFALGAVIGAAARLVAGILTAPKSGKETRADLREKAAELKGEATERVGQLKEKAEEYKERGERAVEGAKKGFSEKE